MNKQWYNTLIDRAKQYIEQSNDKELKAHIEDSISYLDRLEEKLNLKSNKEYNRKYINIAIYWNAVGIILQANNSELYAVGELWDFKKQTTISDKDITDICNIILSRKGKLSEETLNKKIFKDIDKLAYLGNATWNLLLSSNKNSNILEVIPTIGTDLCFEQSKDIFISDFSWMFINLYKEYKKK